MQKTAYEMRISDWSSDVCSSDLGQRVVRTAVQRRRMDARGGRAQRFEQPCGGRPAAGGFDEVGAERVRGVGSGGDGVEFASGIAEVVPGGRKSVVKGKSVSVRVEHGGRRIIKQTNKTVCTL